MMANFTNNVTHQIMDWVNLSKLALMKIELASRANVQVALETCVFLIISITGLVGNVCVCVAVYRNKNLRRKATNIAVVGLALSDVCICTLVSPFILSVLIKGRWIFGEGVCKFQAMTMYGLAGVSLYLMALIGVNRFYCVVKPLKYGVIFTTKSTAMFAFMIWFGVFGTVVAFHLLQMLSFYFHPFKATCVLFTTQYSSAILSHVANNLSTALLVVIPFATFITSYARIFLHVRRHQIGVAASLNTSNPASNLPIAGSTSQAAELKITRTMFVIVLVYVLCWLPLFIIDTVMNTAYAWDEIKRPVALFFTLLGLLSSVINPWIICIMNRTFRKEIRTMLCCKSED